MEHNKKWYLCIEAIYGKDSFVFPLGRIHPDVFWEITAQRNILKAYLDYNFPYSTEMRAYIEKEVKDFIEKHESRGAIVTWKATENRRTI